LFREYVLFLRFESCHLSVFLHPVTLKLYLWTSNTRSLTLSPQIKRELPDKRIGGTIEQPHFDDAALEMLYTSLPARTTNALEYIAFQVTS
jgi:hypothetical protein